MGPERRTFLDTYLNALPSLESFPGQDAERNTGVLIQAPNGEGMAVMQFKVNLVDAPDTGM